METLRFHITYQDMPFSLTAIEAIVLQCAVDNEFFKTHNIRQIKSYIAKVTDCYYADSNSTDLGDLADFIADNWDNDNIAKASRYEVLENYYILKD